MKTFKQFDNLLHILYNIVNNIQGRDFMKINNCYEAAIRMFELSEELSILLNENQKAKTEREKEILSGKIDRVEMDFLTLKHSLDKIPYEEKKLSIFNL